MKKSHNILTPSNGSGRCLIVTPLPMDNLQVARHGAFQRLYMLVMAMARTGLALDIVCAAGKHISASDDQALEKVAAGIFEHWGVRMRVLGLTKSVKDVQTPFIIQQFMGCLSQRWSPEIRAAVEGGQLEVIQRALMSKPVLLLAHRLSTMALLTACRDLPTCVFDMDDIEHVVHKRRIKLCQTTRERWVGYATLPAIARLERQAVRRAWRTLVCSRDDAQLLTNLCKISTERVAVVPNGQSLPNVELTAVDERPVLLMVGFYLYGPNREGAHYFIEHVWPLVLRELPQSEVWFVGASPESIGDASQMPRGVKIMGFVDDLSAVYAKAAVVICPILTGGGTRVKLIEAAMHRKAIVSTTIGAEGLDFADGKEILLRDTPEGMAQACVELLVAPSTARMYGDAARAFAERNYDRDAIADALAAQCVQKLAELWRINHD